MNIPNTLTLFRIIAIPILFLVFIKDDFSYLLGYYCFAIAVGFTDYFDGYLARKYKNITPFGTFFDPLADKIFVIVLLLYFVRVGLLVPWVIIVIVIREIVVTELRLFSQRYHASIPVSWLGKWKACSQYILLAYLGGVRLIQQSHISLNMLFATVMQCILTAGVWIVAAFTILSLLDYAVTVAKVCIRNVHMSKMEGVE